MTEQVLRAVMASYDERLRRSVSRGLVRALLTTPCVIRRISIALALVVVSLAVAAALWLTRRPFTYEARNAAPPAHVSPAQSLDAGAEDEELEAEIELPVELPPEAPPIVRTEPARAPSFEHTENYLLVGLDRTWGRQWGRADTILVAVFDDDIGHVGLVSVPRDLHVEVPGHGPARINATMRIATSTDQDPVELIQRVVSDTLAMPIHHVVVADIEAFERTVDQVGGVSVDVPCPIVDNFIDRSEPSGRRLLEVEAGRQHMDGPTAAMYVRSRHGRSDWDRARRQQAVLLGLRARVREMPATEWVPILADALDRGVTTTMSRLELIGLARRVSELAPERMHGLLLGRREVTGYRTVEGRSVLLPDFDAIDAALRKLFEAPAPGLRPERARCPAADAALR